MKITVDRIEGDMIVAELPTGQTVDIPRTLMPDAAEGDVFSIEKDQADADGRRKRIEGKMNNLFVD